MEAEALRRSAGILREAIESLKVSCEVKPLPNRIAKTNQEQETKDL
jgi:hypothetical protein